MAWTAFELPKLPDAMSVASDGLKDISEAVRALMGILKTSVEILAALDVSGVTPAQLVVKAAVEAIQTSIKSLLEDAGVYVLFVPVRRKVVLSPAVEAALAAVGIPSLPQGEVSPSLTKIDPSLGVASADGGNAGFLRTVVESLDDVGDASRPRFSPTDAVAGFYVVAGASDYSKLLSFASTINALFSTRRSGSSLDVPDLPVPQNLRVKAVPDAKGVTALLEWDGQLPIVKVPTLGDSVVQVTQVCVIRSKSPSILSRFTVQDIFGTGKLSTGKKVGIDDYEIEVLSVFDYQGVGLRNSYYDTTELTKGTPYYYTIGYNLKVGTSEEIAQGTADEVGFRRLSNAVKMYFTGQAQKSGAGTAPDWIRTPSVVDLLPDLAGVIRQLLAFLEQMGGTVTGYGDMLKGYAKFLEGEIKAFQAVVAEVTLVIDKLVALTGSATTGAYFKPFAGVGGTDFLVKDLAQSLFGNDPARPSFDAGDEFVMGMVVLAGAPSPAALAPVQAALDVLFGSSGSALSPITEAVKIIGTAVAVAEQQFSDSRFPPPPVGQPLVGADDDGKRDLNCPAPVESNPVLGDDFKPKE
jgi:hypothetical protein